MGMTPRVPAGARAEWDRLCAPTPDPAAFHPSMLDGLPPAARRWLGRALAPGTPLAASARLSMRGQIRLGSWRDFTAEQVLAPPRGFVWAARTRLFGVPVTGYDRYGSGTGEMRWRLAGVVPVLSATGPDVTRSAAGRLAGEAALLPTAFRQATWTAGEDDDRAVMTWQTGAGRESAEVHVAPDGRLLDLRMQRWGNPGGEPYGRHPFGVSFRAERTSAGITIASELRAGWWWGTDRQAEGEFFRAEILAATPV